MDAATRREFILDQLKEASLPVSAATLAARLSVSRQIIVGDIALLRAAGEKITATPRGYLMEKQDQSGLYSLACVHSLEDTELELNIMVDNGCTVVDVIIDHPIYGQLTGALQISSRHDVRQFIGRIESGEAQPLSVLTGGVHIHSLRCPDEDCFKRTRAALDKAGFLYRP
ncbi:MAG: transcription repressor NadR [Clostridia bacterium]|nr:transcription repressor NadR [Clostridia bacterium]